jgi:hypothetical protein
VTHGETFRAQRSAERPSESLAAQYSNARDVMEVVVGLVLNVMR